MHAVVDAVEAAFHQGAVLEEFCRDRVAFLAGRQLSEQRGLGEGELGNILQLALQQFHAAADRGDIKGRESRHLFHRGDDIAGDLHRRVEELAAELQVESDSLYRFCTRQPADQGVEPFYLRCLVGVARVLPFGGPGLRASERGKPGFQYGRLNNYDHGRTPRKLHGRSLSLRSWV
jgi:hypothetical protein